MKKEEFQNCEVYMSLNKVMALVKSSDIDTILEKMKFKMEYYTSFDMDNVSKFYRFICHDQKEKECDWSIYPSVIFTHINKLFGNHHVFTQPKNSPAISLVSDEYYLMHAPLIWTPNDPISETYVDSKEKIYDFAFDHGGNEQLGLDEFI